VKKPVFILIVILMLFFSSAIYCKQDQTSIEKELVRHLLNVSFFGPRTGITYIPETLYDNDVSVALYSLFGWQMDIRYQSSEDSYIGYGEAGLLLGAVEQGVFQPEIWGYIGVRTPRRIGLGIGPNISKYGIGLGVSPQYIVKSGNLLIPIMLNLVITEGKTRMQIITGFSLDKKPQ